MGSLILPAVMNWLAAEGQVVPLVKPQFEAGREQVGKGGVVRDPRLHRSVIEEVLGAAAAAGLAANGVIRSPITGPAGNVEFLTWLRLSGDLPSSETVGTWLDACVG